MASVPGYVYAQQRRHDLYVNLFVGGTADIKLDSGRAVKMTQETRYPWDGAVRMTVTPDRRTRLHGQRPHSRLGARTSRSRAISIASSSRPANLSMLKVNGQVVTAPIVDGYCQ